MNDRNLRVCAETKRYVYTPRGTFDVVRFVEKGPGGLGERARAGMTGILFYLRVQLNPRHFDPSSRNANPRQGQCARTNSFLGSGWFRCNGDNVSSFSLNTAHIPLRSFNWNYFYHQQYSFLLVIRINEKKIVSFESVFGKDIFLCFHENKFASLFN